MASLAMGALTAVNPTAGMAGMALERGLRGRIRQSGDFVPTLGKSLNLHQVLPASAERIGRAVANAPRTDIGKAVLSSVGGNPRIVNQALSLAKHTKQISHFDSKKLMREGVSQARKHTPHAKSLNSL